MQKFMKIILSILGVMAALIIIFILFLLWSGKQPMVKDGYYNDVQTNAPLEQKYTLKGNYEVSYYEQDANNEQWKKYEVWYPAEMETSKATYPLVVMVNGTGVAASKYKPIFEHLASWGFIVIGNEDESAGNGVNIPCFMVAGTKKADAGDGKNSGICPLIELQEKYDNISDSVSKVIARRRDTDHGDMLPYADGYMTAWFMYHLKGDEEAGVVFFGDNAEILNNANWQDVQKNR